MIINFQSIDKYRSTLLIGIGQTNRYLKEIVKPDYTAEAREIFGDCDLVDMYEFLAEGFEDRDIFLLNLENQHDYLTIAYLLDNYDFAYIVPIDIYLSDSYLDPLNNGRRTYYLQSVIERATRNNDTTFIVTDKHASLYQDVDLYLEDMEKAETQFRNNEETSLVRENLIFVANNLVSISWGNVVLARMFLLTDGNEYPVIDSYLKTVFRIDFTDNVNSMAYFQTHVDFTTTIENLLNFGAEKTPTKIVTVYRICLYIKYALEEECNKYIGTPYSPYKAQQIESVVTNLLESLIGSYLIAYEIIDVYPEENPYHAGTVDVILRYSIWPVGCAERYIERTVRI